MYSDLPTFVHELKWSDVPEEVQAFTRRCLLDLLGVAASGTQTRLSNIIRQHASEQFGCAGAGARMLFDGRRVSPTGAALAGGMTIDSVDAHDGHKLCKGHVGCGVLPGWLAFVDHTGPIDEQEFLTGLLAGYEIGSRAGIALHDSACDYHTSGAWVALAVAAIGARILKLDHATTREALGIAEYHGPRSQMMRCIDYPGMVKDGSGWGAMAGVSAAFLARDGFTGAPAITVEDESHAGLWGDLGRNWRILEQYFKPFPVCRWAQPAVIAAINLRRDHPFKADDIAEVEISTFHESWRLATTTPTNTEEAQYSLPFPTAAALVHGRIGVAEIDGEGLYDANVLALSKRIRLTENESFNTAFPAQRLSRLKLELKDGRRLDSGVVAATGDPESPFSEHTIDEKFLAFASPVLGRQHALNLRDYVRNMGTQPTIEPLFEMIYKPGVEL